jgi:SagB-type dehydrogenase family enzyme
MNINEAERLTTQDYEPTRFDPGQTWLTQFDRKNFGRDESRLSDVSAVFHENTKLNRLETFKTAPSINHFLENETVSTMQAELCPDYRNAERHDLPTPEDIEVPLSSAIGQRRSHRQFTSEGLSIETVSTLLYHTAGVTGRRTPEVTPEFDTEDEILQEYRSYPSAGALYPVELYFLVPHGNGDLEPGIYYYVPNGHYLRVLEWDGKTFQDSVEEIFVGEDMEYVDADLVCIMSASFWRAKAKYGSRGYRYVMQEAGHIGQNLLLTATALGLGGVPLASFTDNDANDLLGIDGFDEAVVYTASLGHIPRGGESRE